jgi:hypothetical protein
MSYPLQRLKLSLEPRILGVSSAWLLVLRVPSQINPILDPNTDEPP